MAVQEDLKSVASIRSSSTELSKPTTTAHDEAPFRFFELPPELRDCIYDMLTDDYVLMSGTGATKTIGVNVSRRPEISIKGGPLSACLLLCHQFTAEYLERTEQTATLTLSYSIQHTGHETLRLHTNRVAVFTPALEGSSLQRYKRVHCRLDVSNKAGIGSKVFLRTQGVLESLLAQMPAVETLQITIRLFEYDFFHNGLWEKMWSPPCLGELDKMAEVLGPQSFTVSARVEAYGECDRYVGKTWDEVDGWSEISDPCW